ncbi:HIRAN domain-containing protein [Paraburkholderia sp. J10-1]|uniref:HIRAN domain-containing protein n=1 Tax=Paraburkholderia sp. J10-1 TaxID=2805430 RepID=UPI002AB67F9F|nr:HIRAN domain-containing protein [Paraburkholderia sp. J10-1]
MRGETTSYKVKGTRYYAAEAALSANALKTGSAITLVREPTNKVDPNAVAVYLSEGRRKLGHISRSSAPDVGARLERNGVGSVVVTSIERHPELTIRISVSWSEGKGGDAGQQGNDRLSVSAKSLPSVGGAYLLSNIGNGRMYVGSSMNIRGRALSHVSDLRCRHHCNFLLQRDYDLSGGDVFEFSVVGLAANTLEAERLEAKAIDEARRKGNTFYNMTADGKGAGMRVTPGYGQTPIAPYGPSTVGSGAPVHAPVVSGSNDAGKRDRSTLVYWVTGILFLLFLVTRK